MVQPSIPESQEQGKMEVDHPAAMHSASEDKDNRTSDVQEEIEQRWHQVETIPLREEKQVPITTALGNSGNSDRLPSSELAALLDKEVCLLNLVMGSQYVYGIRAFCVMLLIFFSFFVQLGHKQKELDRLQKENNLLKEQLEDAIGREQNAREGYVLQVLHST